jgi:hypothetical protein
MGKCPHCKFEISELNLENVTIGDSWKGVSYVCPHCSCVVGAGIDPVALRTETVSQTSESVAKALVPIQEALRLIFQELRKR